MFDIRPFDEPDWRGVWQILAPVFQSGESYPYAQDISETEARRVWIETPSATFVAVASAKVLGTYYIKPNQPGLGSHVCNCGYAVSEAAQGQGIASAMCEHSQEIAVRRGFRCMQYNLVVSTNEGAVRLWQKHGFEIVGTLPQAFRHPRFGFVDAYVMHKQLTRPAKA